VFYESLLLLHSFLSCTYVPYSVDVFCSTSACRRSDVLCIVKVSVLILLSVFRIPAAAPIFWSLVPVSVTMRMPRLLCKCVWLFWSSLFLASVSGSAHVFSRVWVCYSVDIVSLAQVSMMMLMLPLVCVCVCVWVDVVSVMLECWRSRRSLAASRSTGRESKPIGRVWTALIAVEPNLQLLCFIQLSKHLITYRPL
jgi:hypothetical protein